MYFENMISLFIQRWNFRFWAATMVAKWGAKHRSRTKTWFTATYNWPTSKLKCSTFSTHALQSTFGVQKIPTIIFLAELFPTQSSPCTNSSPGTHFMYQTAEMQKALNSNTQEWIPFWNSITKWNLMKTQFISSPLDKSCMFYSNPRT